MLFVPKNMLRDWLGPLPMEGFLSTHLGKQPYACPGTAAGALPLFGWDTLARVLGARERPDVMVASGGRLVRVSQPCSGASARRLMADGFGIVVRKAERHDAALTALAEAFSRELPGEVHVQLYATPANTNTFAWHFDSEDVFIAQTVGTKNYYFRENVVGRDIVLDASTDFGVIRRETTPMFSATLVPGDFLYLPSRWWHLVRSVDDALSISIGVMPETSAKTATTRQPNARAPR